MPSKKNAAGQDLAAFYTDCYACKGDALTLGAVKHDGKVEPKALVKAPLKTMNRHGLIAGATGTGKTKTLQLLAEGLSDAGVPVLLMDIKGDLSGLAAAGESDARILERHKALGLPWTPASFPAEFLSLTGAEPGVRLRATVSEYGPLLLSRVLELNETQAGVLAVLFKYCDGHGLPLLDLKDLKEVLRWAGEDGQAVLAKDAGQISGATLGTILRKVAALESQGTERFFGEPSFDVQDLLAVERDGRGVVSVLRLADIQTRPQLYSAFMLSLLAEIYQTLPEAGDLDRPKLVVMVDEAHLLFDEGSKALLQQLTTMVKLIRSKGVGLYFCTQLPGDVPDEVLSQLGLKIQHALRAFTARDRQDLKLAAQNYADSPFYANEDLLTSVGIGEAAVTLLDEHGDPTPVAHVLLQAPRSRMGVLSPAELAKACSRSPLVKKYAEDLDQDSAYEKLTAKVQQAQAAAADAPAPAKPAPRSRAESLGMSLAKSAGRTVVTMAVRGLFNALLKGGRR